MKFQIYVLAFVHSLQGCDGIRVISMILNSIGNPQVLGLSKYKIYWCVRNKLNCLASWISSN